MHLVDQLYTNVNWSISSCFFERDMAHEFSRFPQKLFVHHVTVNGAEELTSQREVLTSSLRELVTIDIEVTTTYELNNVVSTVSVRSTSRLNL